MYFKVYTIYYVRGAEIEFPPKIRVDLVSGMFSSTTVVPPI